MTYETDQRLKNYLDTNQLAREQMCLAVIAIDKRFSNVRPRHPRGGPDGARDIEAIYNGAQRAFGAVGFINQATDGDENKKAVKKKFNSDLKEALKQDSKPEVFIFFTNVNLTVGEKDNLVKKAKKKGLAHAEIYDRERLRLSLDNPDGLSIRYQSLGIPLSEAEQATFFARWGDEIQDVITDGFQGIQRLLNRIHFLQEAALPMTHLAVALELDKEYTGKEIGHFRAFALFILNGPINGIWRINFGSTDRKLRSHAKSVTDLKEMETGIANGISGVHWETATTGVYNEANGNSKLNTPNEGQEKEEGKVEKTFKQTVSNFSSVGQEQVRAVYLSCTRNAFFRVLPEINLQNLDDCNLIFCLNKKLAEKVQAIRIYANEYQIMEIPKSGILVDDSKFPAEIPLLFDDNELTDAWVRIRPSHLASAFKIRFSEQTPKRYLHPSSIPDTFSK